MNKNFIIYISLMIIIFAGWFLSKQTYTQDLLKKISPSISKFTGASLLDGLNFNTQNINTNTNANANTETNINPNDNTDIVIDPYKLDGVIYNSTDTKTIENIDFTETNKPKWDIPVISEISQKVADSLKSGGEVIANTINSTKENISTTKNNIENYFSGISNAIQGKENISNNNNCPPVK